MPDLTSIATTLRQGGFSFTGWLSVLPRTIVLRGTVSAVPSYPALQVSYTLTGGDEDDVTQDMTVEFYSAAGDLKAVMRVASGQTVTSTVLPLNEFAAGTYNVVSGDTFLVYEEYRIFDRLVKASANLEKDSRITYSDQLSNPIPVCNSGGPYAGFSTTVNFYGSTSFTIDPDSSGTLSHSWEFGDGTPSTSSSANPTGIVFPVGFRYVKHTVTDSSNSKSSSQYIPVFVHDTSTYPPLRVQVDGLSQRTESPGQLTFKLPYGSEGDITNLPDGGLVIYHEREYRRGTEGSYGSNVANRSQVKFCGYLLRDSISMDADQNEVSFEATDTLGLLELTPALPQLLVSTASPTKWSQVRGLSTKEIFWYLSYWGATLQTAWDFVWTDGLDFDYARIAIEGDSIAAQLRDIAQGLNIQVTCDQLGRIQFIRDPSYLEESDRAGRTVAYDLTTADIIKIDFTREHHGSTKMVRGEGITPNSKPVFSNGPGNAPSSIGTASDTLSRQIVSDQSDMNTRTGMHYARVNSLYNGRFVPKGIRITVPDGYDIFSPADREFFTLTLPASTNTRGISFDDTERWTIESKEISYDPEAGTKDITYTLDHETIGVPGVTYTPPPETSNGLPPLADPPPLDVTFPEIGTDPIPGTLPSGGGVVASNKKAFAVFGTDNQLSITSDFSKTEASGGPDWDTLIDLTGLANWGGGNLIQFEADPFSPAYLTTASTAVNGWFVTNTHVQYIEDIFGTVALHAATELHDDSEHRTLAVSRKTRQVAYVATWYEGEGVFAAVTTDYDTWTEAVVTDKEWTDSGSAPGLWISPKTAGSARISVWTTTNSMGVDAVANLYKTTNTGTSWSLLTVPDVETGQDVSSTLVTPFSNTGSQVIHRKNDVDDGIMLIRNQGGVEIDITPEVDGSRLIPPGLYAHEFAMPDQDKNTLVMIGFTGGACAADWELYDGTHGVEIDRDETSVTVEAQQVGGGDYYIILTTNPGGTTGTNCARVLSSEIISGPPDKTVSWVDCGASLPVDSGIFGDDKCIWLFQLQDDVAFTAKVTFGRTGEDDECGDCVPAEIYGVVLSKNVQTSEPTWAALGMDTEYRQVMAMSSKSFLVWGVNGAIGVANTTEIDSRKGDLVTAARIVGVAGAG